MIIKLLLVVGLLGVAVPLLRGRSSALRQLMRRAVVLATLGAGVVAVLFPGVTTDLAHAVGVGRGTDLVLYALCVAFLCVSASLYLRLGEMHDKYVELSRRIALDEAARELRESDVTRR